MPLDTEQFIKGVLSGEIKPSRVVHKLDQEGKPLTIYMFSAAQRMVHAHFADSEREIVLPSHIVPWHYSGDPKDRIPIDNQFLAILRHYAEEAQPEIDSAREVTGLWAATRTGVLSIVGILAVTATIVVISDVVREMNRPTRETLSLLGGMTTGCKFYAWSGVKCLCGPAGEERTDELDGWGQQIVFDFSSTTGAMTRARSAGPDGRIGTDDDLEASVCLDDTPVFNAETDLHSPR